MLTKKEGTMKKKQDFIKNIYLKVAVKDDFQDNLVGIRITKNEEKEKLTVIFPIGYNLGNQSINEEIKYKEEYNTDIKSLIQCLSIKLINDDENKKIKFSFISAIKLIQDFQKLGLYKESIVEENKDNSGKINWKKTINNSNNKLLWKNSRLLQEIYFKKTNYNYQGKIQQIQKYCLGFISMVIGPFYNFNYPKFQKPASDSEMIKIIEKEMLKTNVDNKKLFLTHLKKFIAESNCVDINSNNKQVIEFGTKKFYSLWEKLVDKKFGGIKDSRKYNPKAIYLSKKLQLIQDREHKIAPSRPDTIIDYTNDKEILIIDAKYYKIGNLPGEYDINKQLRYAEYCAKQKFSNDNEKNTVYNIFILPNIITLESPYFIESFATNENSYMNKNEKIDGRKLIAVCYVDTKKLISMPHSYWKKELNNILEEIDETYKYTYENCIK